MKKKKKERRRKERKRVGGGREEIRGDKRSVTKWYGDVSIFEL